jgi:hypothetical protein
LDSETKGLTLEELDAVFNVPTKTFIQHTMHEAVPYWFKRWIFWRRDVTLRPLVEMDNDFDPVVFMPQEKTKSEVAHHEEEKATDLAPA